MKLICEMSDQIAPKIEGDNGPKNYYIEGIFIQGDLVNANGRSYPVETLVREVARYNQTHISKGRAVGELDHPDSPSVNYKEVSHKIISLEQDGNNFIGKALVLNTPNGNIVKGLMDGGVALAVSTRGVGSIKTESNVNVVQPDFTLSTIDIVVDPSAPDAFVNGIMEGKEWLMESGMWKAHDLERVKKAIHKKSINEAKIIKQFQAFCNQLLRS